MDLAQEQQQNQMAFRRLKDTIARTYAPGRFVAISEGRIVADASGLDALRPLLEAMGKDPRRVLAVQAGVDYPETAVIFLLGRCRDAGNV
jgi:hypothetical protein